MTSNTVAADSYQKETPCSLRNCMPAELTLLCAVGLMGTACLTGRHESAVPVPPPRRTRACPNLLTMLALHLGLVYLGIVFIAGVLQAACSGGTLGHMPAWCLPLLRMQGHQHVLMLCRTCTLTPKASSSTSGRAPACSNGLPIYMYGTRHSSDS